MGLTREEAKSKASIRIQFFDAKGANKIIDQIYNDHETAIEILMKANEEEISRHFNELKAKDELLDVLHKAYAEADYEYKALSVQLKAKKEENNNLHRLMGQNTETINEAKKARSIVAMLFWEWRKSEARIYATNIKWKTGRAFQSQILFEAAYKILKEQQ